VRRSEKLEAKVCWMREFGEAAVTFGVGPFCVARRREFSNSTLDDGAPLEKQESKDAEMAQFNGSVSTMPPHRVHQTGRAFLRRHDGYTAKS
jgi:hypothetical protein